MTDVQTERDLVVVLAYATADIHGDSMSRGGCTTMLGRYAWAAHMVALG